MMGDCPKCGQAVLMVGAVEVQIQPLPSPGHTWRGLKYYCLACGVVLGVQMDPISLKADIVDELFEALRQGQR